MKRKHIFWVWVGIFIAIVAIALIYININPSKITPEKNASQETTFKIINGGEWLLQYRGNISDPGVLWILYTINNTYCHKDSVAQFINTVFQKEFAQDPIQKGYGKLIGITKEYIPNETELRNREAQYDNFLLPALYCDQEKISTSTQKKIFNINTTGYDLTHRVLGLLFLKQNKCIDAPTLDSAISQAVLGLRVSLTEMFGDIYVEKIAFAEYAGYKNMFRDEEIQEILKTQSATGAWKDSFYFGGVDNPHTTALSVWALAQYYNICPFK